MRRPDTFVFAACGPERHLARLEAAAARLRARCENPVWVVTDAARNERPLRLDGLADSVVDVRTAAGYDARQSAIVLKTSLHRHLPGDRAFCYLDTDVLALDAGAEQVFLHARGGATFAPDHMPLRPFSPHAVRCGCVDEKRSADQRAFLEVLGRYYQPRRRPADDEAQAQLQDALDGYQGPVHEARGRARRGRWVRQSLGFTWREDAGMWTRGRTSWGMWDTRVVHSSLTNPIGLVEARTTSRYDAEAGLWRDAAGRPLFPEGCDHLREAIRDTFGVDVDPGWQHWNGGVFVLDERGAELLELWHEWTLRIFGDERWRTRDQGTLVAAVWRLGLQDRPTLPVAFNFIARANDPQFESDPVRGLSHDGGATWTEPHLVHAMHGWDDPHWALWTWLQAREEGMPATAPGPVPARSLAVLGRVRARVWWMHVLPPAIACGYVAALLTRAPFGAVAAALPFFVASGAFLAAFGYALNDALDVLADARARKSNGMLDLPRRARYAVVATLLALGLLPWAFLPRTPFTLGLLLLQIGLLVAYSAPPVRLKTRGLAGLLCDSAYGAVVPACLALATFGALGGPVPGRAALAAVVGVAAIACKGLRNMLGHQLGDRLADEAGGQRTFVAVAGPRRADGLRTVVSAAEAVLLVATLVLLWPFAPLAAGFALFLAHTLAVEKPWRWGRSFRRRFRQWRGYALNDFHEDWLAPAALVLLAVHEPRFLLVLAVHLAAFPGLLRRIARSLA